MSKPHPMEGNDSAEIDESLYSRQLHVIGFTAMKKMSQAKVLLCGLGPLGGEVAKNLILAGLQNLFIHDLHSTTPDDLSNQIFLHEATVGQNRATGSVKKLAALNPQVTLTALERPLDLEDLNEFNMVVLAMDGSDGMASGHINSNLTLEDITSYCHQNNILLVLGETRGLFFRVFCDFGEAFVVTEPDEVEPAKVTVISITNDTQGVVSCLVDKSHGFQVGDIINFSSVTGMKLLEPRVVLEVISANTFTIGDTADYPTCGFGGTALKEKVPKILKFKEYSNANSSPTFLQTDFRKDPIQIHASFAALHNFLKKQKRLPKSSRDKDEFMKTAKSIHEEIKTGKKVDSEVIQNFLETLDYTVPPLAAFLGGILAQEVIKGVTGRFLPLQHWMVGDFLECEVRPPTNVSTTPTTIFGKDLQTKLSNLRVFVVGAGAIGCEVLKNLAVMGIGSGPSGNITVTDMDCIERSNLSRQFLFRSTDIGKPKSLTAAEAILQFNPKINIVPHMLEVGHGSESVFDSNFFEGLDCVINALDNIAARYYMDEKCVEYKIPLLESGTQGTKGNTQIIIPNLTKCYRDNKISPPEVHPKCTLTFFPYKIEHTIQWARDKFEELFTLGPKVTMNCVESGRLDKTDREQLYNVKMFIEHGIPSSYEDCVDWAMHKFNEFFVDDIVSLTKHFPADATTESGLPYWVGTKRFPKPFEWTTTDLNDQLEQFVNCGAKLYATVFGINVENQRNIGHQLLKKKMLDARLNSVTSEIKRLNIPDDEENNGDESGTVMDDDEIEATIAKFASLSQKFEKLILEPLSFEKDDDTNFHIAFITAASNLRAANYGLDPADCFTTKRIAGKIIPAISTTTSVVAGLICMELYKLFDNGGRDDVTRFKDTFVSLSNPQLLFVTPGKPGVKIDADGRSWSIWTNPRVEGDVTIRQLLVKLKEDYGIEASSLAYKEWLLYYAQMAQDELDDIMDKKVTKVIELVCDQKINPTVNKSIRLYVLSGSKIHENILIPPIKYVLSSE